MIILKRLKDGYKLSDNQKGYAFAQPLYPVNMKERRKLCI